MNLVVQLGVGNVGGPITVPRGLLVPDSEDSHGPQNSSTMGHNQCLAVMGVQQQTSRSRILPISVDHRSYGSTSIGYECTERLPSGSKKSYYQPPPYHPNSTYGGLPYQDHNYVAPLPCTPPQSPLPSAPALPVHSQSYKKVNGGNTLMPASKADQHINIEDVSCHTIVTTSTGASNDDSVTRCICDFQHDDGYMICCDRCAVWQHVDCMRVDRTNIPENYLCEQCEPRKVDRHRAILIQTRKRDDLSFLPVDSSSTETEDETDGSGIKRSKHHKPDTKKEVPFVINGSATLTSAINSAAVATASHKKRLLKTPKDIDAGSKKKWKANKEKESALTSHKKMPSHLKSTSRQVSTDVDSSSYISHISSGASASRKKRLPSEGDNSVTDGVYERSPRATYNLTATADNSCDCCVAPVTNRCSSELQSLLANIQFNGLTSTTSRSSSLAMTDCASLPGQCPLHHNRLQYCRSRTRSDGKLVLEATEDIITNQLLIEYIGDVALRHESDLQSSSEKSRYMLFYNKLDGLELCVDASPYNEDGRSVRRSCTPNAEVRHAISGNMVRFFIHATRSIVHGAEITIPFDVNYHKCGYVVECSCTRASCPVTKFLRRDSSSACSPQKQRLHQSIDIPVASTSDKTSPVSGKQSLSVAAVTKPKHRDRCATTDSVSCASSSQNCATDKSLKSETPIKPFPRSCHALSSPSPRARSSSIACTSSSVVQPSIGCTSTSVSFARSLSNSDSDDGEKAKKKTREEKKLEAIMKAFERMEKRQGRRRESSATPVMKKAKEDPLVAIIDTVEENATEKVTVKEESKATLPTQIVKEEASVLKSGHEGKIEVKKHEVKAKKNKRHRESDTGSCTERVALKDSVLASSSKVKIERCKDDDDSSQAEAAAVLVALAGGSVPTVISNKGRHPLTPLKTTAVHHSMLADRLTGVPKKLLQKGVDQSRPLTIQTEEPGSDSASTWGEASPLSGRYLSSHQHRGSVGGTPSPLIASGCRTSTETLPVTPQPSDNNRGFAKKRWLHQAMLDSTGDPSGTNSPGNSPRNVDGTAAGSSSCSPGDSPTDIVTPLKKRRLVIESTTGDVAVTGLSSTEKIKDEEEEGRLEEYKKMDEVPSWQQSSSTYNRNVPAECTGLSVVPTVDLKIEDDLKTERITTMFDVSPQRNIKSSSIDDVVENTCTNLPSSNTVINYHQSFDEYDTNKIVALFPACNVLSVTRSLNSDFSQIADNAVNMDDMQLAKSTSSLNVSQTCLDDAQLDSCNSISSDKNYVGFNVDTGNVIYQDSRAIDNDALFAMNMTVGIPNTTRALCDITPEGSTPVSVLRTSASDVGKLHPVNGISSSDGNLSTDCLSRDSIMLAIKHRWAMQEHKTIFKSGFSEEGHLINKDSRLLSHVDSGIEGEVLAKDRLLTVQQEHLSDGSIPLSSYESSFNNVCTSSDEVLLIKFSGTDLHQSAEMGRQGLTNGTVDSKMLLSVSTSPLSISVQPSKKKMSLLEYRSRRINSKISLDNTAPPSLAHSSSSDHFETSDSADSLPSPPMSTASAIKENGTARVEKSNSTSAANWDLNATEAERTLEKQQQLQKRHDNVDSFVHKQSQQNDNCVQLEENWTEPHIEQYSRQQEHSVTEEIGTLYSQDERTESTVLER